MQNNSIVSPTRQHVSTDHMFEIDSHKRNSLQSLQYGYSGSFKQLQSLTILHSKTDYSRGQSEVTLGADKRRKLLTQEDFDLKTLNQKISFDSNESSSSKAEKHNQDDGTENLDCSRRIKKKSSSIQKNTSISNNITGNPFIGGNNINSVMNSQIASLDHSLQQLKLGDIQPAISNDSRMKSSNLPLSNIISSSGATTAVSAMIISENNSNNIKASISNYNNNNTMNNSNPSSSNQFNLFALSSLGRKKLSYIQSTQDKSTMLMSSKHTTSIQNNPNNVDNFIENIGLSQPVLPEPEDVYGNVVTGQEDNIKKEIQNPQNTLTQMNVNQLNLNLNRSASGQHLLKSNKSNQQLSTNFPTTGMKLLDNILAIGKVKQKLLSFTGMFKYQSLGLRQFNFIADVASEGYWMDCQNTNHNNSKQFKQLLNNSSYQDKNQTLLSVISPDHWVLAIWDIIVLSTLITLIVIAPIDSAFSADFEFTRWYQLLCASIFAIDIVVNLNRGIYSEDILNILAAILFDNIHIVLIFLASLYRLGLIKIIWERIEEDLEILHRFPTIIQMIDLSAMIFFIAHLCACGFFYISKSDYQQGIKPTWIVAHDIQDSTWDLQYLNSLYFGFITMTIIGYGDIVPSSSNEKIFVIFMTLMSCGVFGYSINQIGQIFKDLPTQLSSFKQTKYDISKYLKSRNIAKKVQMKIYKYLEYLNRQENEGYFFMKGEKILNRVSQDLREEVQREYYGKMIQSIPLLKKSFSGVFLDELSLHMKELNLAPGEYLFKQGSQDSTLFFLSKGELDISVSLLKNLNNMNNFKDKILSRVNTPQLIGHQEFLTDQERNFSVKSLGISHFIYITKSDFLNLIKKYQLDYETFSSMKDDLIYKGIDRFSVCESCKNTGHNILKCRLIFGKTECLKMVRKMNYSEDNQRSISIRRQRLDRKHKQEYWRIRSDLVRFRKDFISKAIKKNQEQNKKLDSISEESVNDVQNNNNINNLNPNNKGSPRCETETGRNNNNNNNTDSLSNPFQQQQQQLLTQPNSIGDQLTMKSYSKKQNNTSEGNPQDDREFFNSHERIKYEEGEYLIVSSSSHSNSGSEDDDEGEYQELDDPYAKYEDEQLRNYRTEDEGGIQSDQRKTTMIGGVERSQRKRQTGAARTAIPGSPNSKGQDMQLVIPSLFSLDAPNPTFLVNRHSMLNIPQGQQQQQQPQSQQIASQSLQSQQQVTQSQLYNLQQSFSNGSSSMNSLPLSQLSAIQQYQQQNSLSAQNTSPNLQPVQVQQQQQQQQQQQMHSLQPLSQNASSMNNTSNTLPNQNTNINQLILSLNNNRNYFDQQDPIEESDNNNNNSKKPTIALPTVDEASEAYEQSQELLSSTFSNQLSSSPLVRKPQRKESTSTTRRHTQRRITSSNETKDDPRNFPRNPSRNDSLSTQKIMRDSRKVTLLDFLTQSQIPSLLQQQSQQLYPQQQQQQLQQQQTQSLPSSYLNILNSTSFTLPRTISKSQSRNSRFYQTHMNERIPTRSFLHNSNSANPTIHSMFIYNLDITKEFMYYYPHNNLSTVLKSHTKYLHRIRTKPPRKLNSNNNFTIEPPNKNINIYQKTEGAHTQRVSKSSKQVLFHSPQQQKNSTPLNPEP